MEVDCEGCAGCCIDWRALARGELDHERRGRYRPLDGVYNLAVLTREEVRAFLDTAGDALTPRLFRAEEGVTVGGETLAAVAGRPAFLVGLRKPPKPVAPFGADPAWLPTCAFLDPATLQCRIHDDERYPADCADYPGANLALDAETECERVEREFGGERLLDDTPPEAVDAALGPQAVGWKVFAYPEFDDPSRAQRAPFLAAAAASAPGTATVARDRYREALAAARAADSWVGRAAADWERRAGGDADPRTARAVEDERGAPPTPGWEQV
ncbi:MAG: YkgJ family cysteine cluster protein [Halobacteriaceae archaeon]